MNIFKKHVLSLFIVSSFVSYALYRNDVQGAVIPTQGSVGSFVIPTPIVTPKKTPPVVSKPTSTPAQTATPPPAVVVGKYKNGTYNGDVADAYYGDMQVQVVISGGNITAVNALKYPNDRSTSLRINGRALPILKKEAISAQSAKINAVSGASYSSPAFIESLASALKQAKV